MVGGIYYPLFKALTVSNIRDVVETTQEMEKKTALVAIASTCYLLTKKPSHHSRTKNMKLSPHSTTIPSFYINPCITALLN
jgi:hypothetical protein